MGRIRLRSARVVPAVAALAALAACGTPGPVAMSASPRSALEDTPVTVTITGLSPDAAVTVTATTPDYRGQAWSSSAQFTADGAGRVSLAQQAIAGSYRGRDAMGLFETLAPAGNGSPAAVFVPPERGFDVTLQVRAGGRVLAHTTVHRQRPSTSGRITDHPQRPATSGIYGELYLPAQPTGRRPAVLAFGGSEGGMSSDTEASVLAAHGYPALALAYFAEPGLPKSLTDIPLEYFVTALKLLAAQPAVDPHRIYTLGASRGSEPALLLAARFPQLVHGVIATSPSSVVNGGIPRGAAWTLGGEPLPAVPDGDYGKPDPVVDAPQAIIPVQNIPGPVVLLCGGADRLWRSCPYADAIAHRRAGLPTTLLRYPDAGHWVTLLVPYLPYTGLQAVIADGRTFPTGGTVLANQQADAAAWPRILAILNRS